MGSTIGTRMSTGKVLGTGAEIAIAIPWTPRKVELYNETDLCHLKWTSTMGNASGMKTVTAGTITFITTNGVTPVDQIDLQDGDRGFLIGADTDINVSDQLIHWVAFE